MTEYIYYSPEVNKIVEASFKINMIELIRDSNSWQVVEFYFIGEL